MAHSRLLKFLVAERDNIPKMAENNTEVQSEVPGAQKLRGDAEDNADSSSKPKIISSFIEVHTEVDDGEKVVRRHQIIRNGDTGEIEAEEKQPTKIPISRLRQTVEKVKARRQNSKEKQKEFQSQIPRRSSLPKQAEPSPLDEEFDKLFQEVVNPTDNTVVDTLESKFEEIRHDYDENKIQPIDVDKIKKSKIPFLKRRSLQEGDSVQMRTNKIIAARDKIRLRKSISSNDEKYEKISKDIVESIKGDSDNTKNESDNTKHENESTKFEKTETQNETDEIKITRLDSTFENNDTSTRVSEVKLIKTISQESEKSDFNVQKTELIYSDENGNDTFKTVKIIKQTFENQNYETSNNVTKITKSSSYDDERNISSKETKTIKSYSYENDQKESPSTTENDENTKNTETPQKYEAKFYKTFSIESDNDLTSHKIISSIFENQNSKIASTVDEKVIKSEPTNIETNKKYTKNILYEENKIKYSVQAQTPTEKSTIEDPVAKTLEIHGFVFIKPEEHLSVAKNIAVNESVNRNPEIHESNFTNEVDNKNVSQHMKLNEFSTIDQEIKTVYDYPKNLTVNIEKETFNFDVIHSDLKQNEFEISKTKVHSGKETAIDFSKEKEKAALFATTFKGKVGRMISKIDSKETIELDKNSIDETPKNKSILSKIAMFERHEPEIVRPKKTKPKLSKLITKDIQPEEEKVHVHTPLIVHEILKPFEEKHARVFERIKSEAPITEDEDEIVENKETEALQENTPKPKIFKYEIPEPSTPISDAPVIIPKIRPVKEILSKFENKSHDKEVQVKTFKFKISKNEVKIEENKPQIDKTFNESINEVINKVDLTSEDIKDNVTSNKEVKREINEQQRIEPPKLNSEREVDIKTIKKEPTTANNKIVNKITKSDEILPNGNVKKILHRIKSYDKFELNKKEVSINIKELPRQRSVSEKIALFEGKLTPTRGQDVETTTLTTTTVAPTTTTTPEDLQEKINELSIKYGSIDVPGVQLSNGVTMPMLAVGTANLNPKLIKYIIGAAIDMGYRAIDSAYIYGNEKEVGEAIRAKIEDGTVKREDLFIINKLWSTFHQEDLVRVACESSLKTMGLDYFDLYLVHNPMSFKEGSSPLPKIATVIQYSQNTFIDAWHGMSSLVTAKLVRAIGVSNFNSKQVQRVMDKGKVKPVVNQVECHPYLSQERLRIFCQERNITLSCFGVLGSKGTPAQYRGIHDAVIDDPLVKVLALGLGITPAQLLISYQLKNNHTVVVKSSTAAHLWDNIQAVNVNLTSAEVEGLNMLNKNKRMFNFKGMGDTHRNYPFNIPF